MEFAMFAPISGLQVVDLISPFISLCSEKRSKVEFSAYWTPRTATDIQHAVTTSSSSSRYSGSKNRWEASISTFLGSPSDKHQDGTSSKIKVLDDVEMQDNQKDKDIRRSRRMSSLKLPKSRARTSISDKEKAYEKSSRTTSATIFSPNIGSSSTLKKRRPRSYGGSLSALLPRRENSMKAPNENSNITEILPSGERPSMLSSSVNKDHKSAVEVNPPLRRRSAIMDWKKKAHRLSLPTDILAPSARMSPYAPPPYCKSTDEWDRLSINEDIIPKPTHNRLPSAPRSVSESKKWEKRRSARLSIPPLRSISQPSSSSTSRKRPVSSIGTVQTTFFSLQFFILLQHLQA